MKVATQCYQVKGADGTWKGLKHRPDCPYSTEESRYLAGRKTILQSRLEAIGMCNVRGRTNADLAELELDRINTTKELNEIDAKIDEYARAR